MSGHDGGDGAATIPALLAATAGRHGEVPAVVDGDVRLTYAELAAEARTVGAALVAAGVERGNRVAIWAPNGVRWIAAVLGLFEAGATLVPINTRFKGGEAAEILRRTDACVLITTTDLLGTDPLASLRATGVELPALTTVVVVSGDVPEQALSWEAFLAAAEAPDDAHRVEAARRAAATIADDVSDILFTSGTTGTPKGVVQTHGRTLRVASDWVAMTGLTAGDRYLMVNPYFHMFGLKAGILASVTSGATMYPEPVFDADRALARVASEQITVLPGAPTLYQSILDHPGRGDHDLSSLRIAVTGAADIPVELIRRIREELPFELIVTGYGLTEGGTAAATDPDDDPEATAAALSPDGWLSTGDLGTVDAAGNLRIVGRSKDMYIVGGFNAYPAEIENILLRHPDIAQVAVIGIPDARLGEVGMAFVVARPGSAPTEEAVIAWAREAMANYKAPRAVELVDELPINATGKVVKEELRARVAAR